MSAIHIKQWARELAVTVEARTNIAGISKPSIGKSQETLAALRKIAALVPGFHIQYIDAGTMTPNDIVTFMPDVKSGKLKAYPNSLLPNTYDTPDMVGAIVIDEAFNADAMTFKFLQKYINGEDVSGVLRKPDGVICVLLSNRLTDKAGAVQQSRALLRRLEQVDLFSDAEHNYKFADSKGFFPVVLKFFEKFPALIDNYEEVFYTPEPGSQSTFTSSERPVVTEEGKRGIWAHMGSWERISMLEYAAAKHNMQLNPARVLASVGSVVGRQYVVYRATYDKLATVKDILADPTGVEIPTKMDELFVTVNMLTAIMEDSDINAAAKFINRLQGDLRIVAIDRLIRRQQKSKGTFDISNSKPWAKWIADEEVQKLIGTN